MPAAQASHLDGQVDTLVRMYPPQENQVAAGGGLEWIERQIDSVVDSRDVIQAGRPVRVTDRDKIAIAVLAVNGHDPGRRESVNGSKHRRGDQAAVSQGHKIIVAVNEVELGGVLEHF